MFLPDHQKPHLVFFYTGNKRIVPDEIEEVRYPYLSYLPMNIRLTIPDRIVNKIIRTFKLNINLIGVYSGKTVEFIYPCMDFFVESEFSPFKNIRKIYWIPDFQEKYYPQFFSQEELDKRETKVRQFMEGNALMCFSSNNSANDFKTFYPENTNTIKILRFASVVSDIGHINAEKIFQKYSIHGQYFISPNQFWTHKNHSIIIEAVYALKQKGISVSVFFTGREFNKQNPDYALNLKQKVRDLGLETNIRFLGFIDRNDQLVLMKNARAVIQPSLFEGWSTVVEDTKATGGKLLVSDIPIHREQCTENTLFFDPHNAMDLAEKMLFEINHAEPMKKIDYINNIRAFAENFINLNNISQ